MTKKRRKDDTHDIGDSKPGDVGDSKGTHHDTEDTPMARIHNRRDGELLSKQETEAFLTDQTEQDESGHSSDENAVEKYCGGSRDTRESEDTANRWEDKFEEHHLPGGK